MIKNLAIGGGSNRLLLIFALVLGLLCAVLIGVYLSSLNSGDGSSKSAVVTAPVVVAVKDIPAATQITEDMLVVKAVPTDLVLANVFKKTSDAIGQTTQVSILAGEQVVPSKVASAATAITQYGPTPPLSVIVPTGTRAFSISISATSASGGLVRAGDHIDVLMVTSGGTGASGANLAASFCYVAQDVQVLAIGTTLTKATSGTDVNAISSTDPDPSANTMTLAVNPGQAGSLAAAASVGNGGTNGLSVVLRNFADHEPAAGVNACDFTAAPAPAS